MDAPTPYYDDGQITIYHGDCRKILPQIVADVLVTDPPYGISFKSGWTGAEIQGDSDTELRDWVLRSWPGRAALVFGAAGERKLLGAKVALVWHRPGSGMGDLAMPWKPDYELIHVFGDGFVGDGRRSSILSYPWDVFRGAALHPHQKPVPLMRCLLTACPPGVVVDPFMGSGSTLRAAKDLGRKAIGIELEERYCASAVERLAQGTIFDGMAA